MTPIVDDRPEEDDVHPPSAFFEMLPRSSHRTSSVWVFSVGTTLRSAFAERFGEGGADVLLASELVFSNNAIHVRALTGMA